MGSVCVSKGPESMPDSTEESISSAPNQSRVTMASIQSRVTMDTNHDSTNMHKHKMNNDSKTVWSYLIVIRIAPTCATIFTGVTILFLFLPIFAHVTYTGFVVC